MAAARRRGALGSKNVGTSNHNSAENAERRKIKVSFATTIDEGLVGPKPMAKAAGDGQSVNIPTLLHVLMEGRSAVCRAYYGFVFMM